MKNKKLLLFLCVALLLASCAGEENNEEDNIKYPEKGVYVTNFASETPISENLIKDSLVILNKGLYYLYSVRKEHLTEYTSLVCKGLCKFTTDFEHPNRIIFLDETSIPGKYVQTSMYLVDGNLLSKESCPTEYQSKKQCDWFYLRYTYIRQ